MCTVRSILDIKRCYVGKTPYHFSVSRSHSTWTSQVHIAQPSAHIGKSTNHIRFILSVSRAHRAPSTDRNSSVKAFRAGFSALTGWVYRVRSLYAR